MADKFDYDKILAELRNLLSLLPSNPDASVLSGQKLSKLRNEIKIAIEILNSFAEKLDPVKQPSLVFNPADPQIIGTLIAKTMLEQPRYPLNSIEKFYGSGVYVIYYNGSFDAYRLLSKTNHPIYVGKADPASHGAVTVEEQGTRLCGRLTEHAKSISAATNLDLADFDCRFLVVKSAWQKTSEDYLIELFRPVWNNQTKICYGFGKHGDSSTIRKNTRSPWDTIHPGRPWADEQGNIPNPKTSDEIKQEIIKHLVGIDIYK